MGSKVTKLEQSDRSGFRMNRKSDAAHDDELRWWSTAEYGNSNELDIKVQRSGRMLVIMLSFCHVNILRKRSYQTYLQVINTY